MTGVEESMDDFILKKEEGRIVLLSIKERWEIGWKCVLSKFQRNPSKGIKNRGLIRKRNQKVRKKKKTFQLHNSKDVQGKASSTSPFNHFLNNKNFQNISFVGHPGLLL